MASSDWASASAEARSRSRAISSSGPSRSSSDLQFVDLRLVALEMQVHFREAPLGLGQFLALSLPQFAGVLDRLLGARNLGAGLVVAALHDIQFVGFLGEGFARGFDRRFDRTQLRDRRPAGPSRVRRAAAPSLAASASMSLSLQREQLGAELALFLLQGLVAPRGGCLPLQMPQLLLDFFTQVVQPLEVLLRVRNAVLGLAPALLVLRDAGRFLDEAAQLLGLARR